MKPSFFASIAALCAGCSCAAVAWSGSPSSSASGWPGNAGNPYPYSSISTLSPTAVIEIGTVIGTQTSLPSATAAVNKFLGVPFAQSPPKRFSPPANAAALASPLHVTQWKPSCLQQFNYPLAAQQFEEAVFNQPPPEESEDCLYLNIYAPSSPPPPGGRAVLFWIYGGGLAFGTAGTPIFDGSAFAAYQDVILVSTNYRTNVFGFPGSLELSLNGQNIGFLDQRFALKWVQRNIAQFGGDPTRVTLFGESAGSYSVDALLTTYTTDTAPFNAAILESGSLFYKAGSGGDPAASWKSLASALNCTGSALKCIRAAPALTIQSIIEKQGLGFLPQVDNITLVSNPVAARAAGNFAKVPIISGTNSQEGRLLLYGQNNFSAYLQNTFGPVTPGLIPKIKAAFPLGNITGFNTDYDRIAEVATLAVFRCPQGLQANETAAANVPTWLYLYNASFPNLQLFPGAGAYHTSEMVQVFQTYSGGPVNNVTVGPSGLQPTNIGPTAQQAALSSYMNAAWATFAKNPQAGPGWNKLGTFGGTDVGVLGTGGSSGVSVRTETEVNGQCALLAPFLRAVFGV